MIASEALKRASLRIEVSEAKLLLSFVLKTDKTRLTAHPETPLTDSQWEAFTVLVDRRAEGVPVPYLIGRQAFYGLDFLVTNDVLIPRPDTETLVEEALAFIGKRALRVLDIGTGSGAIALAIKHEAPESVLYASDISDAAIKVAQANATSLHLDVTFKLGAYFKPWTGETFDLIVSNPPYVARGDAHLQNLTFEPASALISGEKGLDAITEIVRQAPEFLAPSGMLALEHGYNQGKDVCALFQNGPWENIRTVNDLGGNVRVTTGTKK